MTLNNKYPGVKNVAQVKYFQFCPDLPSPMNVLLFAFEDCRIDLATACRLFETRYDQASSSLKAYCEQPTQEPGKVVLQAFFTETKEISKILKEVFERKYITLGFTQSKELAQATVYCPISSKHTYVVNTFQGLPLNIPEDTKQKVTEAVKIDILKNPQFQRSVKVDDYIVDILLDTTFEQGPILLRRYCSGKMTLITQSCYESNKLNPGSLYLYRREFTYPHGAYHHFYCSICKTLDFHDTIVCPKSY